jgi:hypothetical protein
MGERRCAYRIYVGKGEGKKQFETPRQRWDDNIKTDLQELGWEYVMDLSGLGWDRWWAILNAEINVWFP